MIKMSTETLQSICNYGQYVAGALTAIFAIGNVYFGNIISSKKEAEQSLREIIVPGNHKNADKVDIPERAKNTPDDQIMLVLGNTTVKNFKVAFIEGINAAKIFDLDGVEPIILRIRNDTLYLSARITDRDGKIICEIADNEWTINQNNYFKRNYDKNAIEVIDQYGDVVLSAELVTPNTILFYAIIQAPHVHKIIFCTSQTMAFISTTEAANAGRLKKQGKTLDQVYRELANQIPHKFSYSGKDYLGKRK